MSGDPQFTPEYASLKKKKKDKDGTPGQLGGLSSRLLVSGHDLRVVGVTPSQALYFTQRLLLPLPVFLHLRPSRRFSAPLALKSFFFLQ